MAEVDPKDQEIAKLEAEIEGFRTQVQTWQEQNSDKETALLQQRMEKVTAQKQVAVLQKQLQEVMRENTRLQRIIASRGGDPKDSASPLALTQAASLPAEPDTIKEEQPKTDGE